MWPHFSEIKGDGKIENDDAIVLVCVCGTFAIICVCVSLSTQYYTEQFQ